MVPGPQGCAGLCCDLHPPTHPPGVHPPSLLPPQVARRLWAVPKPPSAVTVSETEWAALQARGDVLIQPEYMSATLTSGGMVKAVGLLGELGAAGCGGGVWGSRSLSLPAPGAQGVWVPVRLAARRTVCQALDAKTRRPVAEQEAAAPPRCHRCSGARACAAGRRRHGPPGGSAADPN